MNKTCKDSKNLGILFVGYAFDPYFKQYGRVGRYCAERSFAVGIFSRKQYFAVFSGLNSKQTVGKALDQSVFAEFEGDQFVFGVREVPFCRCRSLLMVGCKEIGCGFS